MGATASDPMNPGVMVFRLTEVGLGIRVRFRPMIAAATDRIVAPLSDQKRSTRRDLLSRTVQAYESKQRT